MTKLLKATTILATLVSVSAMGKVNCTPFTSEADMKTQIVTNFNETILKLQTKADQMQIKVEDRMSLVALVETKIQQVEGSLYQIKEDSNNVRIAMKDIKASLDDSLDQEQYLVNLMADLDIQIQNARSRSNDRRNAMREKKRTERKLMTLQSTIDELQVEIAPMKNQLSSLKAEKKNALAVMTTLNNEKLDIEAMKPSLKSLVSKKNKAQQDMVDADQNQEINIQQMDKANESVLMCKTYNVKYPVSLSVSKELYTTGCQNYQLRGYKGIHKIAAEQETIISVCD
jgi:chromosome segregation ATPase